MGIATVVGAQAFNSFSCFGHDIGDFLSALGASLLVLPWLVLAYHTDCVRPYRGGGASMVYAAVLLWGTVTSLIGALLSGPILKRLGITVTSP